MKMTSPTSPTRSRASPRQAASPKSTDYAKGQVSLAKEVKTSLRRLFTTSSSGNSVHANPADTTAHSSSYEHSSSQKTMSATEIVNASVAGQRRKTNPVLKRQPFIKHAAKCCSVNGLCKKGSGGYVPPVPHPLLEAQKSQSKPSSRRGSLKERVRQTCRRISQRLSMRGSTCSVIEINEED